MSERDFRPYPGMIVKHFKGGLYLVLGVGNHTENREALVAYQSIQDGSIHFRPYDMFCSPVDKEKYPEVQQEYRLEEVPLSPKEKAEAIISKFENLVAEASHNESPIRFNDEAENDLVLYFNEEYGKIFVDKSFIK